ncbi:xylulokinase [Petroclostridium sp. X23]|uniref:xylulokinase n=1 Tax=Petroclostridium sp. X23 TaxID=3045146 RepID=UPI0024AE0685|nr:xylulokinase [Petroclostridium sp. X23]WHH58516.1 xylulokinase [Petroclostridium sp. X23]
MIKYLLAHDLGTSGDKATLYTIEGQLVKSRVFSYETDYFNNNWVEQDPEDWWKAVCATTKEILNDIDSKDVAAVSFSGQMMGCLCVDRNGTPLRKSIIWADQRAAKETQILENAISQDRFYRISGHRISPSYSLQKLLWIKNNEPEIYENTYKMLNSKDYIIFKLTGEFVTDYSDATGTCILNLNTLQWSDEIIAISGIDGNKLPTLRPSTYVVGGVTEQAAELTGLAAGTPVVCGGGDGVCAAVGAGCIKEGTAFSYVGSSSWIALTTEKPIYDDRMRTFNWAHIVPGYVAPCGTMQCAGGSYNWLKNEICKIETREAKERGISPYQIIDEEIAQSPAGANGLLYLPYLLGERSPRWNPNAKGAFIGLKMEHQRKDILRSVLEGVTMNLNVILGVFKQYAEINKMVVIGGGAKGKIWRQIMADVYDLSILKPNYLEEATSMGAAVTGGVGVGIFKDFEVINKFIKIESTQQPIQDHVEKYKKMIPIFDESYDALINIYEKLAEL